MGLRNDPDPDGAPGAPARAEVPAGGVGTLTVPRTERSGLRLVVTPAALAGAVALVASESFVGHTVSEGNRGIMVISDGVHVGAAALWSAGTALLAATLWRRRRRGEPRDAKLVAARFSVVATYALAAVAVSGTVLAVSILGGIGGVLSTDFGRMLLLKLALVAPIVGIGWWNHRVVVPAIARGDCAAADRLRITATVEVALFIAVVAATALLVGADPTT
jgi:copper transport protein